MSEPAEREGLVAVRGAQPADSALLLAWRNDPVVRGWSRTSQPIDPAAHADWLAAALADPDRHVLVVTTVTDGVPFATTRYGLLADDARSVARRRWEISITVAPWMRGRGLGSATLRASDDWLRAAEPTATEVVAMVRVGNDGSRRLFERNGYRAAPSAEPDMHCFVRRWEGC